MTLQKILRSVRNRWHPLWRLRKMPLFRYLQEKFDFVVFTRIPETKTKVAVKFFRDLSWIANPGNLEPEINRVFKLILDLTGPKVFWDVGSNIGYYSWYVRQFPTIKSVTLFEPDPVNFSLLQKTIAKNKIANCELINAAVSDEIGEAVFVIDQASGATGSLEATAHIHDATALHSHYGMGKTITCKTVTIDSLTDNGQQPNFIKIDVEGAEHLVIAGADSYLSQQKPVLIIETRNDQLIESLISRGYAAFQIDEGNLLFISRNQDLAIKTISERLPPYQKLA